METDVLRIYMDDDFKSHSPECLQSYFMIIKFQKQSPGGVL